MANDATQLALVVGSTTAINVVYSIQNQRDTVPVLIANGISFVSLSMIGGMLKRWDLAIALAWVFLIASVFMRGIPLIRTSANLANAKPPGGGGGGGGR